MERLRIPLLLTIIVALSAALVGLWSSHPRPERAAGAAPLPPGLEDVVLPEPKPLPAFRLHDSDGGAITADGFRGRWTFVFFGYTHCPDICPTTLYTLQQVRRELAQTPELLADTHFLFITLDPQRDTPEILRDYVQHFDPAFSAASGATPELERLAAALNVAYAIEREPGRDTYTVNHSAAILLIDAQGRYHARYTPMQGADVIGESYRTIRNLNHR